MTLFQALTGGAFDHLNWQHSREFDQNFSKKSNARGFVWGGGGYGGISMTKFNNQELISNYPNWTCINPKLNGNKPILCSKSETHQTEAEGQKPVSGILSGKRCNANRHNAKRHNAKWHNANRHNAKRHNANRLMQKGITQKGITRTGITQIGITRKGITQIGITRKGITQIPYLLVYKSTFYCQKSAQKNRPRLIHESYTNTGPSSPRN